MLENLPLAGTIQRLFTGTGQCAVVDWQFLGLSIAEWSAIWFALLLIGALWLAIRGSARSAPRRESVLPA
jgi:disulfide bond formation protein DsbB